MVAIINKITKFSSNKQRISLSKKEQHQIDIQIRHVIAKSPNVRKNIVSVTMQEYLVRRHAIATTAATNRDAKHNICLKTRRMTLINNRIVIDQESLPTKLLLIFIDFCWLTYSYYS